MLLIRLALLVMLGLALAVPARAVLFSGSSGGSLPGGVLLTDQTGELLTDGSGNLLTP